MLIASTFWDFFFVMLIWVPLLVVWFATVKDIVSRPDISGWAKAAWMLAVIFLPFLGTLVYLVARPQVFTPKSAFSAAGDGAHGGSTDDLATVTRLHEKGALSDTEYAVAKARLMM